MELPLEDEIFNALGENTVDAGINAGNLAERIAKTNELVQRIKSLENENEKYLNNAYELGQSVQGIKALYDDERSKAESLQSENDQLRKEILSISTDLSNKERELKTTNLAHEQSLAESEETRKRDTKTYLDLCESVALAFINQANLLNDNGLLDKQAHRKVSGICKNLTEHNLTLPVLKLSKVSKKERVTVAEKCVKVSSMDVAVDCNLLSTPEPPKQMVSRATQYVTSTTTRAASTSAFIKTRTTGTNFPEPLAVTVEEALKATVFDLPKPISPINEINFPVVRSAGTQTEIFSNKSVGTCTKLRNIRKTARQLFDSDFLVPIKKESPMNSMENLSYTPQVDMKAGGNMLPVSVQLMDLWNMLGQRLFSAMRNGSALHQEQLRAVNERIDMLHLHLQMEILNCLNLITTENNFCMDNYLLGSMGESHRKRKLSDSSEASFAADQFEPKRKSGEECTSYDSERSLGDNLFTSANGNNSEPYEFHHNDRVGDQAVREFFSMGRPSTHSTESSVLCPDILNNFRKSVITRTKEVQNSKGGIIDTLSSSLADTLMLNQINEHTEVISDKVEEISKMADLSNINELIEAPVENVSSNTNVEKIILEAKDPTDLTNKHNKPLTQVAQDSTCDIKKPLEIKKGASMQENKCTELLESTTTCKNIEITAVDLVLKMFSNSSTKKANIKLKRLKRIKLAKRKLVDKPTFKSHEIKSSGLKNLEETQVNIVDLPENPSKAHVSENDDVEDIKTLTNQNLLKKNTNENSVFYADHSRCSKIERTVKINSGKNQNSESYIHHISCRVEKKSKLIKSDIQDNSVACEEFSSSDTDEMEKIFQKYIVNISPISRLSESSSESEDSVQIETNYNSNLQRTEKVDIGIIEAEIPIHNNWEEHETPQSPPRNEIEDFSFAVAIPLERLPEHDFDYSPQSPKSEINYAVVPKTVIIPENNIINKKSKKSLIGRKVNSALGKLLDNFEEAKYTCLMRRKVLVEPPQESKELIKVRQILEHYIIKSAQSEDVGKCTLRLLKRTKKKEIICTAIIEVIEDTDAGICNIQTPPAPPMTETHKKIVLLVDKLDLYFKEFSHTLLSLLEQRLFNFKEDKLSLEIAINYTLLYIGIIDINDCNKNPARLFIYKCLYYHNKKAVPMIYHILVSYPHILPKQSNPQYDRSDALISTIQCILNSLIYNAEKKDLKHREVFHILRLYYEYERVKPSKEEVVENLMAKIKAGKLENVSFSFALLCKHFGIEWAEREIVTKCLLPALTECYNLVLHSDCYDSQAAVLLESLSFVLKPFPLNSSITRYQQIFTNFLYATNRKTIQDAAACAILRTQRFSYVDCFNSICNWNPNYNLDKNVRAMLKSFMYRKPFKFWRKVINQI